LACNHTKPCFVKKAIIIITLLISALANAQSPFRENTADWNLNFAQKDAADFFGSPRHDQQRLISQNKSDQSSGRIVGGQPADIEDYPWQVAIINSTGSQTCGASILSEYWVISAAHCAVSTTHKIRAGVTDKTDTSGQDHNIAETIQHPDYAPGYKNDLRLIRLETPLDFTDPKVQPIPILTPAHATEGFADPHLMAVITGWGRLSFGGSSTDFLRVARLPIVSNEDAVYWGSYNPSQITDDMLCAGFLLQGGTDACQGDSGGPLAVFDPGSPLGYSLAGITSWGTGCARPDYPGVWARVSWFYDWISLNTGLNWDSPSTLSNISGFEANAVSTSEIMLSWSPNQNNDSVILVWNENLFFGHPQNGLSYQPGDTLTGGGLVIYRGSDTTFVHGGPEAGTVNYYKAFAYSSDTIWSIGRIAVDTTFCHPFYPLPFHESFEDISLTRNCWKQSQETGSRSWALLTGSNGGNVNAAFQGNKNARFTSTSAGPHKTRLISPPINTYWFDDVKLSFWYAQQSWSGDQNHLNLLYRADSLQAWEQLGSIINYNIPEWTLIENIDLPGYSGTFQIAFEGVDNWGYGNVIDEIIVTGTYIGPNPLLLLQDVLLQDDVNACFHAGERIELAGGGTTFEMESGAQATFLSGESIHFYPGTTIHAGARLHARIDASGVLCGRNQEETEGASEKTLAQNLPYGDGSATQTEAALLSGKPLVYPNPATTQLTVHLPQLLKGKPLTLQIINVSGQRLLTLQSTDPILHLNISQFPAGMYFLLINTGNDYHVEKLLKQE
jgi:hypothetical protein